MLRKGQQTILLAAATIVLFMVFVASTFILTSTGKKGAEKFRVYSSSYIVSSVLNRIEQSSGDMYIIREFDGRYDISAEGNVLKVEDRNGASNYFSVQANLGRWKIKDTKFLPLSKKKNKIVLGLGNNAKKGVVDSMEYVRQTDSDMLVIEINSSKLSLSYLDEKQEKALEAFSSKIQTGILVIGDFDKPEEITERFSYARYWFINQSSFELDKKFSDAVNDSNEDSFALIYFNSSDKFNEYVSSYGKPKGVWFFVNQTLSEEEKSNISKIISSFDGLIGYVIKPDDPEGIEKSLHELPCYPDRTLFVIWNKSYEGLWWKGFYICGKAYLHIDPWPFYWNPYVACEFEEKQVWRCSKLSSSSDFCNPDYSSCVPEVINGNSNYGKPSIYDVKRCKKDGMAESGGKYLCTGFPDCEPSCFSSGRTGNVTERYGKGSYEELWGKAYGAIFPDYKYHPLEHRWLNITVLSPAGVILQTDMLRGEYRKACYPRVSSSREEESYPPIGCIEINSSHINKPVKIRLEFVYPGEWQRDWEKSKGIRPFVGIEAVFIPQSGKHYALDLDGKIKEMDDMPEWIWKRLNNIQCSPGVEGENGRSYRGICKFTQTKIETGDANSWPYESVMRDAGGFSRPLYEETPTTAPTPSPGGGGGGGGGEIDTSLSIPSEISSFVDSYNKFLPVLREAVNEAGLDVMLGEDVALNAMAAVISQESRWNENVGCNVYNDCGLTQIHVPGTASGCMDLIRQSSFYDDSNDEESMKTVLSRDHAVAIKCGARVLAGKMSYLKRMGIARNNPEELFRMTMAAYNGGGAVVVDSADCYAKYTGKDIGEVTWEELVDDLYTRKKNSCLSTTLKKYGVCVDKYRPRYCSDWDCHSCKGLIMETYVKNVVDYYNAWKSAPRKEKEENDGSGGGTGGSEVDSSGICIHTLRSDAGGLENTINHLKILGAKWMKDLVEWRIVEPSKGERRWSEYDVLYDRLSSDGIKFIPRIQVAPDWAKRPGCLEWGAMPSERHFSDFARFVADFVERYENKPAWSGYVEIWNEPNYINEAYCNHVEPDKFAAMLKAVHEELERRGLRNQVKIVLGGLGPTATNNGYLNEFDFLSQMYSSDRNVGKYYDLLGYHPYGQWNDYRCKCSNSNTKNAEYKCNMVSDVGKDCWAFDRMSKVYEHLKSLGDDKKFLITEFSWRESEYDSSYNLRKDIPVDQWQMENLVRAYSNMFKDYPFLEKPACYWVLSSNGQWAKTGDLLDTGSPYNKPNKKLYYCMKNLLGNCDEESLAKAPLCPCKQDNKPNSLRFIESQISIKGRNYKLLKMSNGEIEVEILPEIGGRIWQIRKSGKQYLFNNIKYKRVSNWGINRCSNGNWLPIGGIELSFPDSEHGCIYEEPFSYEIQKTENSLTVHLYKDNIEKQMSGNTVKFRIDKYIAIGSNSPKITEKIEVTNKGRDSSIQLWINAMVRTEKEPLDGYDISLPCSNIEIHSTNDQRICSNPSTNYCKGLVINWPESNGIDMSKYGRAFPDGWLGFFGKTCSSKSIGISDGSGSITLNGVSGFSSQKFFGPGNIDPLTYSEDGKTYVELWLGASRNFDTDIRINQGEKKEFIYEIDVS